MLKFVSDHLKTYVKINFQHSLSYKCSNWRKTSEICNKITSDNGEMLKFIPNATTIKKCF